MNQTVVYTLNTNGNLGCFPECMIVDTDEKGQFSVNFVKVSEQNKSNYTELLDAQDEKLLGCCLRLEKNVIISKIKDRHVSDWDKLIQKYFNLKSFFMFLFINVFKKKLYTRCPKFLYLKFSDLLEKIK